MCVCVCDSIPNTNLDMSLRPLFTPNIKMYLVAHLAEQVPCITGPVLGLIPACALCCMSSSLLFLYFHSLSSCHSL